MQQICEVSVVKCGGVSESFGSQSVSARENNHFLGAERKEKQQRAHGDDGDGDGDDGDDGDDDDDDEIAKALIEMMCIYQKANFDTTY